MKLKSFNKDNRLKQLRRKKNKDKYIMISTISVCITVLIIAIMYFTFARYESLKEFELLNSSVGEFRSGDYVIAAYVDGNKSKNIPDKDSGYYLQKVECENGALGTWDTQNWSLTVENAKTQTKCYVYFTTLLAEADTTGQYSLLSRFYPVGSYYYTSENVNPSTIFGGTWEQITDKVLVAAGSTYTAGSSGGNGTLSYTPAGSNSGGAVGNHTLTINEMPSHNHGGATGNAGNHAHTVGYNPNGAMGNATNSNLANVQISNPLGSYTTSYSGDHSHTITAQGGGLGHNHPFTQPTFTGTQATLQVMNSLPRETMYVWHRTA